MTYNTSLTSAFIEPGLAAYMQQIKQFPMLSQEEESTLVKRWLEKSDIEAAHQLVMSHLRLVVKISLKFRSYGLPIMDIISEGNIGLMKAVKKFKPEKGNRLSTYAIWWIKACIQDYIIKSWSMLKISSGILQKKLFSNTAAIKRKIGQLDYRQETEAQTKAEDSILENSYYVTSLNETLGDEHEHEVIDTISDNAQNQEEMFADNEEKKMRTNILKDAIKMLDEREQDIIKQRKLSETPITLDVLSKKYGVSSERIRQIEEIALKKIKDFITSI
ncbi:RNA polymerase factor sigma-32 [Candidatus Bandiella euplotis]|uniref:RNA polymerase sigma factor RpoH n=1 Tax=Candidatus Bandiella euplotis TaxID=1664265 RepID=A0ABZ0UMG7_9RICK|nr:RNA polymerase factor sigma-32 [Candidatus Bandiella woodruffii]WPX95955.1 RNA polymerase sigma factor RpoH [Candidatus Bandiella woodruffii]